MTPFIWKKSQIGTKQERTECVEAIHKPNLYKEELWSMVLPHTSILFNIILYCKKKKHSFIGKVNKLKARSIQIKYNLFHDKKKYASLKVIHATVKINHRLNKEDKGFFSFSKVENPLRKVISSKSNCWNHKKTNQPSWWWTKLNRGIPFTNQNTSKIHPEKSLSKQRKKEKKRKENYPLPNQTTQPITKRRIKKTELGMLCKPNSLSPLFYLFLFLSFLSFFLKSKASYDGHPTISVLPHHKPKHPNRSDHIKPKCQTQR